ncbi:MAG TPA: ABC-2 family transporter protein [Chloroflexota bacterium]|nr:ABC-2 family transporter protein [Chloroflexota bacterium]
MSNLRLLWVFFRLGALNELAYRANFFVQFIQSSLGLATALIGLAVVFAHTATLGGWRSTELLALVGIYFVVGGSLNVVIKPSMQQLMEDVRLGTLDFTLTKPADAQLLVSVKQVELWELVDVVLGIGVLAVALVQLGAGIGIAEAIGFVLALACGAAIVYSFLLILTTLSFWVVRVTNILVVFQAMYEAGRWPVGIYPTWLRLSLTFIVPVAFAITVPAEALVGRLDLTTLLGAVGLALALLAVSRWFWTIGIRRYSGASA